MKDALLYSNVPDGANEANLGCGALAGELHAILQEIKRVHEQRGPHAATADEHAHNSPVQQLTNLAHWLTQRGRRRRT